MQLFITDFILHDSTITLTEERVIHQLKHVLRAKVGAECKIQYTTWNTMIRYAIRISDIWKEKIIWHIIDEQKIILKENNMYLIVALPNKFEKMELVVQKCTEIWIRHIVFFPSQYSQIRELSQNKIERLWKIALEAVEQSYGVVVPKITFVKDIQSYLIQWDNIILHQDGE